MANIILSFNGSDRLVSEWNSSLLDERVRFIIRSLALKFDGLRITCLIRTDKDQADIAAKAKLRGVSGPAQKSKHLLLDPDKICRAVDFNPLMTLKAQEEWRRKIKDYCDRHLRGIFCEIRDDGTAPHVHLHVQPDKAFEVELLS